MSISFKCPKCRKPFKMADHLGGRRGKCPACGSQFKIPMSKAAVTQEMPAMPPLSDNPFGNLDYPDGGGGGGGGEPYQPRRRRRSIFPQLLGCMFLLLFLLVAAVGGAYAAVYFKLIKREVAEPYLAKIPFKVPGLTTGPTGEGGPEGTAKGTAPEGTNKEGGTEPKKENADAQAELKFLPDKTAFLVSVNVEGLLASKLYQKLKTTLGGPDADKKADEGMTASTGVPLSGISRIVLGARSKDDAITIFRTKGAITADEIKKNRKGEFTEVKIGNYVMYDAKDSPFCVVDDHTLLIGEKSEGLKKILERDKPPEMIPDLQTVFKQVSPAKTISLAFGPQELRQEAEKQVPAFAAYKPPKELQPLFDSQAFALQIELTAGVEMSASLQCKNPADADALKKAGLENLPRAYFEQFAKANAGKPLEAMAKNVLLALSQIKSAASGDTLNATLAVPDDVGADVVILTIATVAPLLEPPKKDEKK